MLQTLFLQPEERGEVKDRWWGCYDKGLKDKIVPESFSHPAKMAWGLCDRILTHLFDEGWVEKNDIVGDPFGGVGVGGIACAYAGLRFVGVELESHFTALAQQNFDLHKKTWERMGLPLPIIVQGDSREFAKVLQEAAAIITSPPYSEGLSKEHTYTDQAKREKDSHRRIYREKRIADTFYGATPGQLGAMKAGDHAEVVRAIVTSPPYEESLPGGSKSNIQRFQKRPDGSSFGAGAAMKGDYGQTPGQLGQMKPDSYWDSCRIIYQQCWQVLPPGGHMVVVIKAFVRDKKIVDLPGQTAELLEAIGFRVVHRHEAMLTSKHSQLRLDGGEDRKQKKSFFRLLAEKKGAPKINSEVVLCCERNRAL